MEKKCLGRTKERTFLSLPWKIIDLKVLYFCTFLFSVLCFAGKEVLHKRKVHRRRKRRREKEKKKRYKNLYVYRDKKKATQKYSFRFFLDIFTCSRQLIFCTCESMFSSEFLSIFHVLFINILGKMKIFKSPFSLSVLFWWFFSGEEEC